MKKLEIKKFGLKSMFKASAYFMLLPSAIAILFGIAFLIIGASFNRSEFIGMAVAAGVGYPLLLIVFYGFFTVIVTFFYNKLAEKFGGLEMYVEEYSRDDGEQ